MTANTGDKSLTFSAGASSVAVAAFLTALKLWAVSTTGALTVGASLADSALDLLMSAGALAALVYATRPEDDDHTFGHHSVEDLTVLGQTLIILLSAGLIGFLALQRLLGISDASPRDEAGGMAAMAVSLVVTVGLVLWQSHVVRKTGNKVVAGDRLHYLSDLLPTLGALLALELSRRFGWVRADAVLGLAAAVFMALAALKNGRGAWDALMDHRADPATLAKIADIAGNWPGVRGWHDMHTRSSGSRLFVHLHIELDGDLPLREAHAIGAALRAELLRRFPGAYVIIHKDVWGET